MRRKLCPSILVLALALGGWLGSSPAEGAASGTIQPSTADSWLNGGSVSWDTNFNDWGIVRVTNKQPTTRVVVRFDLPADWAIKTATLSLWKTFGSEARTYSAHRITASWVESQVTWNSRATGTPWGTAGGDYNAAATATAGTGTTTSVWISWNILADVQLWQTGTPNYGTLIRDGNEGSGAGGKLTEFSSNHASVSATNKPKLVVTYLGKVTSLTATGGTGQNTLSWVLPGGSPDYNGTLIIRRAGSAPTSTPADGTNPSVGTTLADGSVVVLNDTSLATNFTDTYSISNGTTYYYQAFARDSSNRYSFASATVSATPCPSTVADATYVAVSAASTAATVYWTSADPVLILRRSGSDTDTPTSGAAYTAGTQPWGVGPDKTTVVYSGSVAEKSVLDTVAGRTTTDRYKVFAKTGACYALGLQVDASLPSGTTWSYAHSGGAMLKPGIAGNGTIYPSSMASRITSLSTADGTRSWDPVATADPDKPIQGWLTWLPVGGDVTSGLVGHWKFDEGSGPTAADSSGNGNTGTLNGPTWTTGKISGGLSFDGLNDYVDVGNNSSLNVSYLTISFWVKVNSWVSDGGILAKGDNTYRQYWIWTYGGAVSFEVDQGVAKNNAWTPALGQWTHLALTYDGANVITYKNGVVENTYPQATGPIDAQTPSLKFGYIPSFNYANVALDDVRVYNRALSAAEVSKLHLRGGGWQYRKKISIDKSKVAGPLTDFPVLISLANDQDLKARAQASGADILFTAADGATKLSHEIEKYDPTPVTGATLLAWVKVPSLSATENTDLYMYYGEPGAIDQQNATGVWKDNGYAGVWHLKESGNGTAGEFRDSTSNGNHGQGGSGTAAYVPTQADGWIGKGQNFDGTDDHINVGTPASLNITGTAITLEAWVKYPTAPVPLGCSGNDCFYGILSKGGYNSGYRFMVTPGQTLGSELTSSAGYEVYSQTTLSTNTWYHVVSTYDGVSMKNYINGAKDPLEDPKTNALDAAPQQVWIGHGDAEVGNWWDYPFTGIIDEVRVSTVARSLAWIATEYNNQSCPSSPCASPFLSVGGEEQTTGATGAWQTIIGADQSGRVYSVDTALGVKNWEANPTGVDFIQAAPAAQVRSWSDPNTFGYDTDVIFVATRNATATNCGTNTTNNKLVALRGDTGEVLWTFNGTCTDGNVDWIVGMPYVDYTGDRNRIYVTSKAGGGSQQSLWVIDTRKNPVNPVTRLVTCPVCTSLPPEGLKGVPLETSPTLSVDGSTLYVGNTDAATAKGKLYAINAADLTLKWTFDLDEGADTGNFLQGFVWEDFTTPGLLYFSTKKPDGSNGYAWCLDARTGQPVRPPASPAGSCPWKSNEGGVTTQVPNPSTPLLLGAPYPGLYVGSYDSGAASGDKGKLYKIRLSDGLIQTKIPVGNGNSTVGDVSTETWTEVFVGTTEGKIFKIPLPLP